MINKNSTAFIIASWLALAIGVVAFNIGLWNATTLQLNEKGYYFTVLMFGLFGAISVQKSVRDKIEGIPVSMVYYAICWFAVLLSIALLSIGLYRANLLLSEKGFYAMAYTLSVYAVISVQKNIRDTAAVNAE